MDSKITRTQLYELVWSEPLLALSKRYVISDVGLRKICLRMNVPLPQAGYWNKVKAGKKVSVKELPVDHNADLEVILAFRSENSSADFHPSAQEALQKVIEEYLGSSLEVPETLRDPDPIVTNAYRVSMERKQYTKENEFFFYSHMKSYLRVTPKTLDRALRIMDTLIKAMRKRGHDFKLSGDLCSVMVYGTERMEMTLRETSSAVTTKHNSWDSNYEPNGKLIFIFERWSLNTSIKDGKLQLEEQLSKLIAKIELSGDKSKIERLASEERNRDREEEERVKKEWGKRMKIELQSFKNILQDSERWNKAKELRLYINQVEKEAIENDRLTDEVVSWLKWAREKADWFDPLIAANDELLNDVDPNMIQESDNFNNFSVDSFTAGHGNSLSNKNWPLSPWFLKK